MNHYRNEIPAAPRCRCCLQQVHLFWQENLTRPGGNFFVHCKTSGCPLYYATRELDDWLTMDLKQWNAEQHPRWSAPVRSAAFQSA